MQLKDTLLKVDESLIETLLFKISEKAASIFDSRLKENFGKIEFDTKKEEIKKLMDELNSVVKRSGGSIPNSKINSYSKKSQEILSQLKAYELKIKNNDAYRPQKLALLSLLKHDLDGIIKTLIKQQQNPAPEPGNCVYTDRYGQIRGSEEHIADVLSMRAKAAEKSASKEKYDSNQWVNIRV